MQVRLLIDQYYKFLSKKKTIASLMFMKGTACCIIRSRVEI